MNNFELAVTFTALLFNDLDRKRIILFAQEVQYSFHELEAIDPRRARGQTRKLRNIDLGTGE